MPILARRDILVDLLPCKLKHKNKNTSGWIYLAGAKNFDGFILLIKYPLERIPILPPTVLQFTGFLTEMYHFEMIEKAEDEFQKTFKEFLSRK